MDSIQSKKTVVSSLGRTKLENTLSGILNWIEKSFDVNNGMGSSAYQSMFNTWSPAYPETTGYLLNTLIKASDYFNNKSYLDLAKSQIEYFTKLQKIDGSFPCTLSSKNVFYFDNSQILLGLINLNEKLPGSPIKSILENVYNWLINSINEAGQVSRGNYKDNYTPSYYARSSWAIAKYEALYLPDFSPQLHLSVNYIKSLQNPNKSFNQWSFDGSASAYTHTIIYTLRGLWETALITNDLSLQTDIISSIDYINGLLKNSSGTFCGLYDENWRPDSSFICSAGTAQLIILLCLIYKHTGNTSYLNNIPSLISPLLEASKKFAFKRHMGVPASIPVWGKYQRFRYTNWTQKFVADALLEILN